MGNPIKLDQIISKNRYLIDQVEETHPNPYGQGICVALTPDRNIG